MDGVERDQSTQHNCNVQCQVSLTGFSISFNTDHFFVLGAFEFPFMSSLENILRGTQPSI